jgi:hypothetical protein
MSPKSDSCRPSLERYALWSPLGLAFPELKPTPGVRLDITRHRTDERQKFGQSCLFAECQDCEADVISGVVEALREALHRKPCVEFSSFKLVKWSLYPFRASSNRVPFHALDFRLFCELIRTDGIREVLPDTAIAIASKSCCSFIHPVVTSLKSHAMMRR